MMGKKISFVKNENGRVKKSNNSVFHRIRLKLRKSTFKMTVVNETQRAQLIKSAASTFMIFRHNDNRKKISPAHLFQFRWKKSFLINLK
jgi:hypothetical protein